MRILQAMSLMVGALVLGAAAPAPELEGVWRNANHSVHLRLAPCGEAMCATVVWASEKARADARKGSGQELIGSRLLTGLRPSGNGRWRGRAYVPDINRHATATVTRTKPDQLRVSGCVLLFCQTRHWQRIG